MQALPSVTTVVPVLGKPGTRTTMGLSAPFSGSATFNIALRDALGRLQQSKEIPVSSRATVVFKNVLQDLFGIAQGSGTLFIEAPGGSKIYAVIEASAQGSPSTFMPLPTTLSEFLTSAATYAQRPLFFDGLEQSIDVTRGSRWMLVLNEVGGASGRVNVRLYEPGNRGRPIGEKEFDIGSHQQLRLDTVFAELGLDTAERRKDRANVQVVVTARSGNARVAATAISTDNASGEVKAFALAPSSGSGTPNVSLVAPVLPPPATPGKRRAAGK